MMDGTGHLMCRPVYGKWADGKVTKKKQKKTKAKQKHKKNLKQQQLEFYMKRLCQEDYLSPAKLD